MRLRVRRSVPAVAVLFVVAAVAGLHWWRTGDIGPVQRGFRAAVDRGCLSCHSPSGAAADPEGERGIGAVPSFEHDDVTSHARSAGEIREWILDGEPRRLRDEEGGHESDSLLRMPPWRGRLGAREVDDLVAYLRAVSDFDALPAEIASARDTAARLGCFACHGPQGRGDTPNPGSLKGHVPAWSGRDFAELARDDGEIREWIRDGAPRRLRGNPIARFFLDRQAIRMPAFGQKVSDQEIAQITAYIRWLRSPAGRRD